MPFNPQYTITPEIALALTRIETSRCAVEYLPVSVGLLHGLRQSARLKSTHYSTRIEGNPLSQEAVEQAVVAGKVGQGRQQDEVLFYYRAQDLVETLAQATTPLKESDIQRLHGIAYHGRQRGTPYRTEQNVIRHAGGGIVYLPPEPQDVPILMKELVRWIKLKTQGPVDRLPVPIVAALVHYQIATIHPYIDGNGRLARLLATLILHKHGYGMNGIYALEEYYWETRAAYYAALEIGPSHNYYLGRAKADVTPFVTYFIEGMAQACNQVREQLERIGETGVPDQRAVLRELSNEQRQILTLFANQAEVTARDIGGFFGVKPQRARQICREWVRQGFLVVANASDRRRSYRLAAHLDALVKP